MLRAIGWKRHQLAELEYDDEIFGALTTRRDAAVATPWRLEPGEGGQVEFMREALGPVMEAFLGSAWEALPYGFSVPDVTWARREDGRIVPAEVQDMPIELFEFDSAGRLVYKRPGLAVPELADTNFKMFLTRHRPSSTNPFGEALLSRLYWPWFFRKNLWRFRMEYLERFIDPLLSGSVQDPAAFVSAMQALGFKAVVGVGAGEKIEAIAPTDAAAHDSAERALNSRIQKAVLGQTLTTEVSQGGSFAAAKVHNLVREDKRNADLKMIREPAQRLVDAVGILNFGPAYKPGSVTVVLSDGTGLEAERADRDTKLLNTGRVRMTTDYLLRAYDFEPGEVAIIEPAAPPAPPTVDAPAEGAVERTEPASLVAVRDALAARLFAARMAANGDATRAAD